MHGSLRSYPSEVQQHSHAQYWQLILPLRGALELQIEQHAHLLQPQQAALIKTAEVHSFVGRGADNCCLVLDLADHALGEQRVLLEQGPRFFTLDPALYHYQQFLALELQRQPDSLAPSAAQVFVQALAQRWQQQVLPIIPPRLQAALRYMQQHLAHALTVEQIAQAAHLSASHLHHLIRHYYQQTPQAYLRQLRLDRALALLAESQLSIAEIAQRCGFADQSALTRSLRQQRALTPAQYRRTQHTQPKS